MVCRVIFRQYVSDEVLVSVTINTRAGVPGADLRKKLTRLADYSTTPGADPENELACI